MHGVLGKALYLLKRKNVNKENLKKITNHILKASESPLTNHMRWKSTHFETNETIYNLSLSHGIASNINILTRFFEKNIAKMQSEDMVIKSVNYLLSCQNENELSIFPNYTLTGRSEDQKSRLAWCYGDLGIGITLWQTSQIISDKVLEHNSLEILLHSTERRDLKKNSVVDAGLCHGTAGIAHIFNRVYKNTGNKEFKESADFWFNETIKMAKFEDGFAGFKNWQNWNNTWKNEIGFLNGIAGIGLAMISAVSDIEPKWDECLLLS